MAEDDVLFSLCSDDMTASHGLVLSVPLLSVAIHLSPTGTVASTPPVSRRWFFGQFPGEGGNTAVSIV